MSFKLATGLPGGTIPRYVEKNQAAGYAGNDGALLIVNASDEYAEAGADPATVAAVAQSAGGADASGFNMLGVKGFPPGRLTGIAVKDQIFRARYTGTLPAANGATYGTVRDTDGLWKVAFADVTGGTVKLVGRLTSSPENQPEVLVKFVAAAVVDI